MEALEKKLEKKSNEVNFWGTFLNFGMRAVGAVVSEFTKLAGNNESVKSNIGPIEIVNKDGREFGYNPLESTVMITISATDAKGDPGQLIERAIEPNESVDLSEYLEEKLTGSISWAIFDNGGEFVNNLNDESKSGREMVSIKDWGRKSVIAMFNNGLHIAMNYKTDKFHLTSSGGNYYDIKIMVIAIDGTIYDFNDIELTDLKGIEINYPKEMDMILPIPRITVWARCDENKYNEMINLK